MKSRQANQIKIALETGTFDYREPTDEELNIKSPSLKWFQEKGPWITACYYVYGGKMMDGIIDPNLARTKVLEFFGDALTYDQADDFAIYRQMN